MRRRWAAGLAPERLDALERVRTALVAPLPVVEGVGGPWASKRFSQAVEAYCGSAEGLLKELKSDKEARQRKATMLRLVELHGDKALGQVTTDDLRAFRAWVRTWPSKANYLSKLRRDTMMETIAAVAATEPDWPKMSEGMVQERMVWLLRLFRWLKEKGHLSADVAQPLTGDGDGLTKAEREVLKAAKEAAAAADGDDEEGRVPFDAGALAALFGLSQFNTGNGRHARGNARCYSNEYWLRLLCLWHGLRLSEGAQLWLSDVREVDGVMVLDINRNTPDKSVKNDQSKRLVPLHPELVRLGFLAWLDRLREVGYRRVFPELAWRDRDERYRREPGRKMTKDLEALGYARDGSLTFHSLRGTFNNALARVKSFAMPDMDERMRSYLRYKLMGHTIEGDDHLMLSMLGAVAEFERALIRERQSEGISIAKAKGVYKGRKPSLSPAQRAGLQTRLEAGESKAALAREYGVSRQTLYDYLSRDERPLTEVQ